MINLKVWQSSAILQHASSVTSLLVGISGITVLEKFQKSLKALEWRDGESELLPNLTDLTFTFMLPAFPDASAIEQILKSRTTSLSSASSSRSMPACAPLKSLRVVYDDDWVPLKNPQFDTYRKLWDIYPVKGGMISSIPNRKAIEDDRVMLSPDWQFPL